MTTAFLFPGQGAQFVGMGKKVWERCPAAQRLFDEARDVLGYDLQQICELGPSDRLNSTVISQPALYVCSLAALELLKQEDPALLSECRFAAGLSLGEYTALTFAGVWSFADGLRVVQVRGTAMQAAADQNPSGMVSALMLDLAQIEQIVQEAAAVGKIWIANYLCPGNTVLSGERPACQRAAELIEALGGRAVPLAVAGAFHTPLMEFACPRLAEALAQVNLRPPQIPVVSNVDAQTHTDPEEIRQLLIRQVVHPVKWEDSMRWLLAQGVTRCYELGPGKVLKGLLKRIDRQVECVGIGSD
ncbi:MAG: malonyl CoA-acyl carrier protein transacylase [Planctomycetaceae bacterium]|nr:MAG: malonyl CoA-acyl carrier protein transacylase [Planctomycetaceae bacterium]